MIKVLNLQKLYSNNFHAVKGISFGVEKSQIFALLGPNGSGKSTTFNILTAKISRSGGAAFLKNDIISENFNFSNDFGICP